MISPEQIKVIVESNTSARGCDWEAIAREINDEVLDQLSEGFSPDDSDVDDAEEKT